ncbi:MAG: Crp/Fnr family transcriptional regulator [Bacteroidota bacterium]
MEATLDALCQHPLFSMLSKDEHEILLVDAIVKKYNKNDLICKQGEQSEYAILLLDGYAKLYIEYQKTNELVILLGMPKTFVGLFFMIGSEVYPYSLKTVTKTAKCCLIKKSNFVKIAKSNNEFLFNFANSMGQKSYELASQMLIMDRKNVRGRIAELLLYIADSVFHSDEFILPISRKDIANIANISTENTVRILSEFNKDGIIKASNKRIAILNKPLLKMISDKG